MITVDSASSATGVVTISARSGRGEGAPWLAFEICAHDPPGCAPVWTEALHQSDSTYLADVVIINCID